MITRLEDSPLVVLEVKIGAGPIGEMFMNNSEEVKVEKNYKPEQMTSAWVVETSVNVTSNSPSPARLDFRGTQRRFSLRSFATLFQAIWIISGCAIIFLSVRSF